jgi:hypothetical protein
MDEKTKFAFRASRAKDRLSEKKLETDENMYRERRARESC